jgi:erythromycin esterase
MKNFLIIAVLLILSSESFSQTKVILGSEENSIYPFDLSQPELYFDWAKSDTDFRNVEVFGMGEATHGTKEFFEIKAKSFEYLVTHFNYKVFGIEASYGECNYINDYINSGIGNIDSVMLNFSFWTWRTQEVKNLILWMKDYNQHQPDSGKIIFYGFDMQDPYSPVKYLVDCFKSDTSSAFVGELDSITRVILSRSRYQVYKSFKSEGTAYHDTLMVVYNELNKWLSKNESVIMNNYSEKRYNKFSLCITNFGQAINSGTSSYQYRDSCMAMNILSIYNIEKAKMFIWAHNGHINKAHSPTYSNELGKPMGGLLKKELGPGYYSVGFIFNQGNFQAVQNVRTKKDRSQPNYSAKKKHMELKECSVPVYKRNTFSRILSKVNVNTFFIDLRTVSDPAFTTPLYTYNIGSVFNGLIRSSLKINAKKQYDGLIYIDKTTRAVPLD